LFIPPLRERTEDIPALVSHFLKKFDAPADVRFAPGALKLMKAYHWPGNIREMQNIVERCIILRKTPLIQQEDLNLPGMETKTSLLDPVIPDEGISLEEIEKAYVVKALEKAGQNRSEAARLLKIPRHVLLYRLEKYEL
jgi:two-component system response regulator AtoC